MKRPVVFVALVLLASFTACEEQTPEEQSRDSSGLACDHFRNVTTDFTDGVLTETEFREKLKEVEDNASIATPEVQEAARSFLAAVTTGGLDDFAESATALFQACEAAGH